MLIFGLFYVNLTHSSEPEIFTDKLIKAVCQNKDSFPVNKKRGQKLVLSSDLIISDIFSEH